MKFECDDEAVAPTGLDDIVAERPDDLVDLEQVSTRRTLPCTH